MKNEKILPAQPDEREWLDWKEACGPVTIAPPKTTGKILSYAGCEGVEHLPRAVQQPSEKWEGMLP